MSQENVELLRPIYDMWAEGDFRAGRRDTAPDTAVRKLRALLEEASTSEYVLPGSEHVTGKKPLPPVRPDKPRTTAAQDRQLRAWFEEALEAYKRETASP